MKLKAYTLKDANKRKNQDLLLLSFCDSGFIPNTNLTFGNAFNKRYNGVYTNKWNIGCFDEVKTDKVLIKNTKYGKTTMGKLRDMIIEVLPQIDRDSLCEEMNTLILEIDKYNKNLNILIFVNMNVITIVTENFKIIKFHFHHTGRSVDITSDPRIIYSVDNYLDIFLNGNKCSDLELNLNK